MLSSSLPLPARCVHALFVLQITALGLLLGGCSRSQHGPNADVRRPDGAGDGADSAVALQVLDFEGIQRLIADQRGKVVVLDCWSTSCEPCMKEFPGLVALHRKFGPQRVACISLSFDYEGLGKAEDVQPAVLDFLRRQQATFTNVLCSEESDLLYERLKLSSIPAVFVYDQQGTLVKRFTASDPSQPAFTYEDVEQLVMQLLNG